jgi:hypothetical protein
MCGGRLKRSIRDTRPHELRESVIRELCRSGRACDGEDGKEEDDENAKSLDPPDIDRESACATAVMGEASVGEIGIIIKGQ